MNVSTARIHDGDRFQSGYCISTKITDAEAALLLQENAERLEHQIITCVAEEVGRELGLVLGKVIKQALTHPDFNADKGTS